MGFQDHVTYNGTRYDFRDTEAREQIGDLKSDLGDLYSVTAEETKTAIEKEITPTYTMGYIHTDGSYISSQAYYYTNKIPVKEGDIIKAGPNKNATMRVVTAYSGDIAVSASGQENTNSYSVPNGINSIVITGSSSFGTYEYVIYNSTTDISYKQKVDNTLLVSGVAADAKSTGIEIKKMAFNPFRYKPFMSHIYVGSTNPPIPNQSIYDIQNSKKLGFDVIEGNVQKTSDNKYICMHGDMGKFGSAVHHIDGTTDISNTAINSVTLSWVQANVRYNSVYDKYQTAPTILEDFLYACKINQMIPMITGTDQNVIEIANGIIGNDNYISYGGSREYTSAPILVYASASTKDEILAMCDTYGAPFIYSMGNPTSFTDIQLIDIIDAVHKKGCWIGMASTYISIEETLRLLSLGFDMSASGFQVNDFGNGNLLNLYGDISFDQFSTTGSEYGNNLILQNGQKVTTKSEIWSNMSVPFISMSSLKFRANGVMTVTIGGRNVEITSDGTKWIWVSALYHTLYPNFVITSTGETTIYSIEYRASRV